MPGFSPLQRRHYHDMFYLRENANIPYGVLTSTARNGRKWYDALHDGDILNLYITEDRSPIGQAHVVAVELGTLGEVLNRHVENHGGGTRADLAEALQLAYGAQPSNAPYSIVHFKMIGPSDTFFSDDVKPEARV